MSSALQQPRHGHEESPRRFVGFPFRLHAHPQADGARDVRRLDREVMCKGEHQGLERVEPGFMGFLHGRPLQKVVIENEGEPS